MKVWLSRLFLSLGVLTFLVFGAGVYLWFADPFVMRDDYEEMLGSVAQVAGKTTDHIRGTATDDVAPAVWRGTVSTMDMLGIDHQW